MQIKIKVTDVVVGLGMLAVCFASIWQGRYNIDPHHWGLMLSNAKDLVNGHLPYKDIFIQYGFGTTLVHAFAFAISPTLIAILTITSIFYAVALGLVYKISYAATLDRCLSVYIFIICSLIHPFVIYPWANYIAFPFLAFGIYQFLTSQGSYPKAFIGGASFGFAILCRESLIVSLILIVLCYSAYDFIYKINRLRNFKILLIIVVGIFSPLAVFLTFLWLADLLNYWALYSVELPKIYLKIFPHLTGVRIFERLFQSVWIGIKFFNAAWLLIGISLICCVLALILSILKSHIVNERVTKIALASLALLSSALHFTEIFRLATGSILGVIVLFFLLKKFKLATIIFFIATFSLLGNLSSPLSGNYFYPKKDTRDNAVPVLYPEIFKYQLWNTAVADYYSNISRDLENLLQLDCGVKRHVNNTMDAFLHVLSPFQNYSITPYKTADEMEPLRPDIPKMKDKFQNRDVVFFQMVPLGESDIFIWPQGYSFYKAYETPNMVFIPVNEVLEIFIPEVCLNKLNINR